MNLLDEAPPAAVAGTPTDGPSDGPASSAPVTTARAAWRRARGPVVIAAVLLLGGLLLALLRGASSAGDLDPTAPSPGGSLAVARLLSAHGSPVTQVPTVGAEAAETVVVPDVSLLSPASVAELLVLARSTDVVVVVPVPEDGPVPGVEGESAPTRTLAPVCGLPAATAAGAARAGGAALRVREPPAGLQLQESCYGASLLRLRSTGDAGSLTLLGSGDLLRNDRLGDDGNAALALGLLGHDRPVRWVLPRAGEGGDGQGRSVVDLLPERLLYALGELGVGLLLLALWRGRRLGPVVVEPLPVVVRAVETVRGRARLYRAASARGQAALALREATRARLARRLGLGAETTPPALVAAVAAQSGRDPVDVGGLLYGSGAPRDDAALVRLCSELDGLAVDTLTGEAPRP